VEIGAIDKECPHCNTFKLKNESAGMCCASFSSGQVHLPEIETPPEPMNGLLISRYGSKFEPVPEVNSKI